MRFLSATIFKLFCSNNVGKDGLVVMTMDHREAVIVYKDAYMYLQTDKARGDKAKICIERAPAFMNPSSLHQ